MKHLATDREILRCIYDMYVGDYPRAGEVYVPIDMHKVAARLGCAPEMLFGRLYYDMGNRLEFRDATDPNKIKATIYSKRAGPLRDVVNFPYLTATLAMLEEDHARSRWTLYLSVVAIVVSVAAAAMQFFAAVGP